MQDLDGIEEIFRCYICLARVKNAQMCPSCSKMCCLSCIKRWITEQRAECPHCRASLHISQLINCRFAAEVSQELDKLRKKTQKAQAKELCTVHNAPLYYYCSTCSIAVCSDCAMFGEMHQGHKFEHLSVVYQRHVEQVRSEAIALRKRLKELTSLMHQVETNVEGVTKAKEERAVELAAAVEQMHARLDIQLKNKLLTLLSYKSALVEEIEHQSSMLHELNRQLAFSPKSAFIAKSGALVASLQALYQRQAGPIPHTIATDFASEVVPSYISASCTLREYSKLRAGGAVFYSSGLETYGQTWRLKVYPNGNGVARAHYLSVFLEMTSCRGLQPVNAQPNNLLSASTAKYDYRIELVNQKFPHEKVTREFASDFEVGECWGYNRFFRLDNLIKDGYLLPDDDVVVLRFYVRPQTYYQQSKDLKAYVAYLESTRSDSMSAEIKRRNSVLINSAGADTDPVPSSSSSSSSSSSQIERDKDYSVPEMILDKDVTSASRDWWQNDASISPRALITSSLPVVHPVPLTVSALQRTPSGTLYAGPGPLSPTAAYPTPSTQAFVAIPSTTSSSASHAPLESLPLWPPTSSRQPAAPDSALPQRISSSDLQNEDGNDANDADPAIAGDDEDEDDDEDAEAEAENDVDAASLFDTLSLENYEISSLPSVYNASHTYPASPYPAWGMEEQDEDEDAQGEGNDNGNDIDGAVTRLPEPDDDEEVEEDEEEEEEEEEEGLLRQ